MRRLALIGLVSLSLASCNSQDSNTAHTQMAASSQASTEPAAGPTTSAPPINAELLRLNKARDRWDHANVTTYRMRLVSSGQIGVIQCDYEVANGISTLTAGPLRHETDQLVAANDSAANQICEKYGLLEDVYAHLQSAVERGPELETASVAYDFRGVPVFIQYPGDPQTDLGGTLLVSVAS